MHVNIRSVSVIEIVAVVPPALSTVATAEGLAATRVTENVSVVSTSTSLIVLMPTQSVVPGALPATNVTDCTIFGKSKPPAID